MDDSGLISDLFMVAIHGQYPFDRKNGIEEKWRVMVKTFINERTDDGKPGIFIIMMRIIVPSIEAFMERVIRKQKKKEIKQ